MRGSLSRIIDSQFSPFIDAFFSNALPLNLVERQESFPKYNIYRKDKDTTDEFTVELSLAGYPKEGLKVSTEDNVLYVEDITAGTPERDYLYKGIASRKFKWSLKLPEFSIIDKVNYVNGIYKLILKLKYQKRKNQKSMKLNNI